MILVDFVNALKNAFISSWETFVIKYERAVYHAKQPFKYHISRKSSFKNRIKEIN